VAAVNIKQRVKQLLQ